MLTLLRKNVNSFFLPNFQVWIIEKLTENGDNWISTLGIQVGLCEIADLREKQKWESSQSQFIKNVDAL